MALDQTYFDAINIDVVKKKYYNANKVEAVLTDVRRQALALTEENEQLKKQLHLFNDQKNEIGDTLLSAKSIAQQLIHEAEREAEKLVAEARERRKAIEAGNDELLRQLTADAEARCQALLSENERMAQDLAPKLEALEQRLRGGVLQCLASAGAELRELLSGPEAPAATPAASDEAPAAASDEDPAAGEALNDELPALTLSIGDFLGDDFLDDEAPDEEQPDTELSLHLSLDDEEPDEELSIHLSLDDELLDDEAEEALPDGEAPDLEMDGALKAIARDIFALDDDDDFDAPRSEEEHQ